MQTTQNVQRQIWCALSAVVLMTAGCKVIETRSPAAQMVVTHPAEDMAPGPAFGFSVGNLQSKACATALNPHLHFIKMAVVLIDHIAADTESGEHIDVPLPVTELDLFHVDEFFRIQVLPHLPAGAYGSITLSGPETGNYVTDLIDTGTPNRNRWPLTLQEPSLTLSFSDEKYVVGESGSPIAGIQTCARLQEGNTEPFSVSVQPIIFAHPN